VTRNNVQNYGKILNDWFSAGKKENIKTRTFFQFTLSRKLKTASTTDLGVLNTHTQLLNKNLRE
jgi:hypothetical protein